jgi:hypothetical protein
LCCLGISWRLYTLQIFKATEQELSEPLQRDLSKQLLKQVNVQTVPSEKPTDYSASSRIENKKDTTAISMLSLEELWEIFTAPFDGTNIETIAAAGKWISERLGEGADGAIDVYAKIRQRILDDTLDESDRVGLAKILAESDSPEGLEILVNALLNTQSSLLYRSILEGLSHMGSPRNQQQRGVMTTVAKVAWTTNPQSGDSALDFYPAIGAILAKLGEPEGISFLRDEAIRGGLTIAALEAMGSESSIAAMNASQQVCGDSSVPILTGALRKNDPSSTEFIWSGQALASLSRPAATSALIDWAKVAPDSCAETAAAWIGGVRDSRSHVLVGELAKNGESLHFSSSRVKELVLASANKLTNN